MLVGVNAAARSLAYGIKKRGGALIIASHNRQAAHALAQQLDCRFVPFEALYTTMHETLVICSDEKDQSRERERPPIGAGSVSDRGRQQERAEQTTEAVHSGYLRPGMTVMDLTALPRKSAFLHEAQTRDCRVVEPQQILLELALLQTHLIAGQHVPREPLQKVLDELIEDE